MKKVLMILSILPIMLFSDIDVQKVTNILLNLNATKPIKFYNANKKVNFTNSIELTTLDKANIVLFSHKEYGDKITIVDSYKKMKLNKRSIGAIYLKKGRTQVVFIKERLDKNGLILNAKFKKHLLHEWQLNPQLLINSLR